MKLKGQARERFERWFVLTEFPMPIITPMQTAIQDFYDLPNSMKFGVYVDFFDSEGYYISMNHYVNFWFDISNHEHINSVIAEGNEFETRHEARTEAIEKANELLNKKLER